MSQSTDAAMLIRHETIPLPDGISLAVTLYLPPDADSAPVPAILEYLPYRKDDQMLARDYDLYGYLIAHGYAGARVDIRGTGRSEGALPEGEYTEQEQADAEAVIAWLAARPWCTGAVGMWGISWGGFNAIQVAMRRPPALRAIIAVDASDDLFHDDVHYIDGLLHLDEYALMIDHLNALPPAPDFPLDEATLTGRFDAPPWLMTWLGEQRDGPYWRRASLRPDYSRLSVPAFLIGGWWDGYRDSVFRMAAAVPAPTRVLIGPWNHSFPHDAVPGPAIEWRAEAVRWWDHWLKGADTGLLAEPPVTVYVQHWRPPEPRLTELPGAWRSEDALPPERATSLVLYCGPGRSLAAEPGPPDTASLRYVPSAGIEAGHWWGELTLDQRGTDAFCLVFDSEPLTADLEILGLPRVEIFGTADASPLNWFARVSDVAPDQTVTLVAGGGRPDRLDPLRDPAAPVPGAAGHGDGPEPDWLPLRLHAASWVFPRGHRIRLAISNAMWPMIWPTPAPATATIRLGPTGTRLVLPVIPAQDRPVPEFPAPAPGEPAPGIRSWGELLPVRWSVRREPDGTVLASWAGTSGAEFGWGTTIDTEQLAYQVADDDPARASAHGEARTEIRLPGRTLILSSALDLDGDAEFLRYRFRRQLLSDGRLVRERGWERRFRRDGH
ncbi:MAG: CocE/NonD family hydrolase [Streptosporangiaceae bacterium]